ncbi:right-handed parallel beta-helix repeat-containing protein [Agrobacterium tumefaciens]|uniref:right-handed parallel beta-helix repeat-containing protein n=1 Tax=Agrobacterium tumefaciens TaxID=358 RepID=UPI0015743541|nr:right-handed parallel beta-helix repeat-containing protein [Agrobacterium tumefaciens]
MSSVFPITDDPRYRRYTASAGQTMFTIPFPFLQGEDLKICLQTAPSEYTILNPADYTLQGANDPAGGTVTLDAARSAGDIILVLGEAILDRMSSIVRDGRFSSKLIDSELDRIRIIEQEFRRDNGRSVKVDYGGEGLTLDTDIDDGRTLMKQGDRLVAGPDIVAIGDDVEAAKNIVEGWVSDIVSSSEVPIFSTIVGLPALSIKAGINAIRVNGRQAVGDDGAWPLAVAVENTGPIEPWHVLTNGGTRRFELKAPSVRPEMFREFGDVDDTAAIKKCLRYQKQFGAGVHLKGAKTFVSSERIPVATGAMIWIAPETTLKRVGSDGWVFTNGDGTGLGGYNGCRSVTLHLQGTIDLNGSPERTTALCVFAHQDGFYMFGGGEVANGYESHYLEINSSRNVLIDGVRFPSHAYTPGSGNHETIQIDYSNSVGFPAFGPWDNTPCENVTIQNCYFANGQTAIGSHSTPEDGLHKNIKVINCTVVNHQFGIRPQGWTQGSAIIGSRVVNCSERGIMAYANSDIDIAYNYVIGGVTLYGIQVSRITSGSITLDPTRNKVRFNTVTGIQGKGVYISNGSGHIANDNQFIDIGQEAITVVGATTADVDVSRNRVEGASVSSSAQYSAIRVAGARARVISNKVQAGSSGTAMYAYGVYAASGGARNVLNDNDCVAGTSGKVGYAAGTLTAIDNRVLLFSGTTSAGSHALGDAVTNYRRLEVTIGSVSGGNYASGIVKPFSEDGTWSIGSGGDGINVPGVGANDLQATIDNASQITITSAAGTAYLRKIHGVL